ncbi:MAG: TlpA family protein disulfide reductase [Pseudomonadota bacterium]
MPRRPGWGRRGALLLVLLFAAGGAPADAEPRRFDGDSYRTILESHRGKPFLMVFWSLECPPCYKELRMLGEAGAGERFTAVFVSTDGPAASARITETLDRFGLEQAESWVFAGPPRRLRYTVDPRWYGELPRSYLFDAAHDRKAFSGVLEHTDLDPLLEGTAAE